MTEKEGEAATSIQTDIVRCYLNDAVDKVNKAGKKPSTLFLPVMNKGCCYWA
jgi:hypothetical protein